MGRKPLTKPFRKPFIEPFISPLYTIRDKNANRLMAFAHAEGGGGVDTFLLCQNGFEPLSGKGRVA